MFLLDHNTNNLTAGNAIELPRFSEVALTVPTLEHYIHLSSGLVNVRPSGFLHGCHFP